MTQMDREQVGTIVVGGGQAGLSVGYHLTQRGLPFVILDANQRVGDSWRNRWDSLRLFTPARYDGLDGMPFPAPPRHFPTKDEVADYLESYAREFELPVRTGVKVDALKKKNGRFLVTVGGHTFEADNVVVAMSSWQQPRIPAAASELSPDIFQLNSTEYRNPAQLQKGDVLVVGAGNSGAEIALDVAARHRTLLSGPDTGHVPIRLEGLSGRLAVPIVQRFVFHRLLTTSTPMGRRVRPKVLSRGEPWVRVKPKHLEAAGVERVPRVVGAAEGLPMLEDNRVVDVANVIWCTGFEPDFAWIDLPVFGEKWPTHERGVVADEPGLYFVGLKFLYSVSSALIHGVGRDAARIADAIAARDIEPV
ncbi:MAG: flavin-containing monooxygenase, partial [Acidimicrobiia bacterium]